MDRKSVTHRLHDGTAFNKNDGTRCRFVPSYKTAAVGISADKVYLRKLQDYLTLQYGVDADLDFTTNTISPANGSAGTYTFAYHTFVSDNSDTTYPYSGCQSADASLKIGSDMVDYDRSITTYISDLTNDPDARIEVYPIVKTKNKEMLPQSRNVRV